VVSWREERLRERGTELALVVITKSTDFLQTPGSIGLIDLLIGSNGTFAILRKKIKFENALKTRFLGILPIPIQ